MKTSNTPGIDNGAINVCGIRSLRESFDDSAVVYVCKVVKREPFSDPDNGIQYGLVTLSVSQTLCGPSRKSLVLPYSFGRVELLSEGGVWQLLHGLDGKDLSGEIDLLCVVIPGGIDPTARPHTGPDGAAYQVVRADGVVTWDAPGTAKEIRDLCQEYNAKDGK